MSEKRRDNRGRLLRTGESQRADGRYEYKYEDIYGRRHSVYSWQLVKTDSLPAGKRKTEPLREQEKEIAKQLEKGIDISGGKIKLDDYFEKCMALRQDLRPGSQNAYRDAYYSHLSPTLGKRCVADIRRMDLASIYIEAFQDGFAKRSVELWNVTARLLFHEAMKDRLIADDPTLYALEDAERVCTPQDSKARQALTPEEQRAFLSFAETTRAGRRMLPLYIFLLGTGCRIGEALALQWEDCDFSLGCICIRKTIRLIRGADRVWELHVYPPKTKSGERTIPMLPEVKQCLLDLQKRQHGEGVQSGVVDGYGNFVFRQRNGQPYRTAYIRTFMHNLQTGYNKRAESVGAAPLPNLTPHILRHTFCTRLCEQEVNPKIIQEIMGHASISVTMDIYTHISMAKKQETFRQLPSVFTTEFTTNAENEERGKVDK